MNTFLITKVRLNRYRTSITIPEKFLKQFGDQIKEFIDRAGATNANLTDEKPAEKAADNATPAKPAAAVATAKVETKPVEQKK